MWPTTIVTKTLSCSSVYPRTMSMLIYWEDAIQFGAVVKSGWPDDVNLLIGTAYNPKLLDCTSRLLHRMAMVQGPSGQSTIHRLAQMKMSCKLQLWGNQLQTCTLGQHWKPKSSSNTLQRTKSWFAVEKLRRTLALYGILLITDNIEPTDKEGALKEI